MIPVSIDYHVYQALMYGIAGLAVLGAILIIIKGREEK